MDGAWAELKQSVSLANRLNKNEQELAEFHAELKAALNLAVTRCRVERKRKLAEAPELDLSDESMRQAARFTDNLPLANYARVLNLVPRLVNVVTCAPYPQHNHERQPLANPPDRPAAVPQAVHHAARPAPSSRLANLLAQAGRGRARARQRAHAAARPAEDRRAVHQRLLRSEALRRGPACIQQPALSRADFPHRQAGGHRSVHL